MAEGPDLTPGEGAEAVDMATAAEPTQEDAWQVPSFSVIIPTWGDHEALKRTLTNLVVQSCDLEGLPVRRDLIVMGDGKEEEAEKIIAEIMEKVKPLGHIRLGYYVLNQHTGSGDFARAAAKQFVECDWVIFCDAGTAVQKDFFHTLAHGLHANREAKFITWDMWQQLDPAPILSNARAIYEVDRSQGLPYVFPGCATAVRSDIYRLVDWPAIDASDWVYFSMLWDKVYEGPDGERNDTPEALERDLVVIPWTLTAAYAARTERKWRVPPTEEQMAGRGWVIGFNQARKAALEAKSEQGQNPGAVPDQEATHA